MKQLSALVKRNTKLYFRDKGMFFTSLITPLILLVLYGTFLGNIYEDTFRGALQAAGASVPDGLIGGCVGGQLVSSLLASCVTVAFCSNLLMVQDKVSGARRDLTVAPVRRGTLALGYYIANLLSTLLVCYGAVAVCLLYLSRVGWYLTGTDVALLLLDAQDGVTEQDTKIAGLVHEAGKAAIIVVNKWDAVEDKETNTMRDKENGVRNGLSYMTYAPVVFLSALTGQRVDRLFQVIQDVHAQNCKRITTGALNSVLADATARVQPPSDKGRRLKIYYMTQASTKPPHFVIFCNDARLFHFSYQRYLENQIREVFGLKGTPVRITIRQKGDKEE